MAKADDDRKKAMAAVQAMFDRYMLVAETRPEGHADFDYEVMKNMKIIDAGLDGSVAFELEITSNYSNLNDVMHGGAAGVIFDMATTTALCPISRADYWFMGGVTRTLNISYLRAVPIGTTVRLSSKVVQHGKTMALIRGEMTPLDGKFVYCTCEHHKVNVPSKPVHMAMRIPGDNKREEQNSEKEASKL